MIEAINGAGVFLVCVSKIHHKDDHVELGKYREQNKHRQQPNDGIKEHIGRFQEMQTRIPHKRSVAIMSDGSAIDGVCQKCRRPAMRHNECWKQDVGQNIYIQKETEPCVQMNVKTISPFHRLARSPLAKPLVADVPK